MLMLMAADFLSWIGKISTDDKSEISQMYSEYI